MAIDPELEKILGLDQGALAKLSAKERDWLTRLLHEVVEPFDDIIKGHQLDFLARGQKDGMTKELITDTVRFNNSVHDSLALMLAVYVVSNFPPDDSMMQSAIQLTAHNLGTAAGRMCQRARELHSRRKE